MSARSVGPTESVDREYIWVPDIAFDRPRHTPCKPQSLLMGDLAASVEDPQREVSWKVVWVDDVRIADRVHVYAHARVPRDADRPEQHLRARLYCQEMVAHASESRSDEQYEGRPSKPSRSKEHLAHVRSSCACGVDRRSTHCAVVCAL
jgi:hypothetical protein